MIKEINNNEAGTLSARRKLGSLEVSSIGIGVQNMSRTYRPRYLPDPR
jgi:hypothetical protein